MAKQLIEEHPTNMDEPTMKFYRQKMSQRKPFNFYDLGELKMDVRTRGTYNLERRSKNYLHSKCLMADECCKIQ